MAQELQHTKDERDLFQRFNLEPVGPPLAPLGEFPADSRDLFQKSPPVDLFDSPPSTNELPKEQQEKVNDALIIGRRLNVKPENAFKYVTPFKKIINDSGHSVVDLEDNAKFRTIMNHKPNFSFPRIGSQAARSAGQGIADMARSLKMSEEQQDFTPIDFDKLKGIEKEFALQRPSALDPFQRVEFNKRLDQIKKDENLKILSDERIDKEQQLFLQGKSGERIKGYQAFIDKFPELLPGSSGIVEDAVKGIARFLPAMGISAVNPVAGFGMTFAQISGMKYDEYISNGQEKNRSADGALISALFQTPIEMAGNLLQIGVMKNLVRGFGAKGVIGRVLSFFEALAKNVTAESAEEYFQQYPDEIADIYVINPELSNKEIADLVWSKRAEISRNGMKAGVTGAVGALILTGGVAGVGGMIQIGGTVKEKIRKKAEEKAEKEAIEKEELEKAELKEPVPTEEVQPEVTEEVEIFQPSPVQKEFISAYEKVKTETGRATLADMRQALPKLTQEQFDAELQTLSADEKSGVTLFEIDDPQQITPEIEAAKVERGGRSRHAVRIDTLSQEAPDETKLPASKEIAKQFQTAFDLTDEQTAATGAIMEARANRWADVTGRPKEDWYKEKITEVQKAEQTETTGINEFAQSTEIPEAEAVKDIEDNPKFQEWFGNSEVVDENSEPLIVYRGDTSKIEEFKSEKTQRGLFYFTDSKELAAQYGDVQPYYLNISGADGINFHGRWWKDEYEMAEKQIKSVQDGEVDGLIWKNTQDPAVFDNSKETIINNIYVVKNPTQIKSIYNQGTFDPADPNVFNQDTKGTVQFAEDGKATIRAFEKGDISTVVHELGHVFRRDIADAQPSLLKAAEDAIGVKDGKWTRANEEKFAKGFESYLRTGKAPTISLKKVFEQFKQWLSDIYKGLKGTNALKKLSPELTKVFDRMLDDVELVTDKQIEAEIKKIEKALQKKGIATKTVIGRVTGTRKVKDIIEVDTRQALRDQLRLEARAAREAFRAGKNEAALAATTKARELLEKNRQKKQVSELIKDIKKIKKQVDKGQQFSQHTQDALESILNGLDATRPTQRTKLKLQATKDFLDAHPDNEMPEEVLKSLERLEKKPISDLTFDELTNITDAVKHQVHLEKLKNKLKANRKSVEFKNARDQIISELRPAKEIKGEIDDQIEQARQEQTGFQVAKKGLKDFLSIRQLGYDTFIEYLFGRNSVGYDVFFRQIKKGTRSRLGYQNEILDQFTKDIKKLDLKGKDFDDWLLEKPKVKGVPYKFTRNERMSLYRHSLNEDNRRALTEGGFGFRAQPDKVFEITDAQLDRVVADLTKEELQIAGQPTTNLFDAQREAMNKVFLEKNGFNMPLAEGGTYYPKDVMAFFSQVEERDFIFTDNSTRVGTPKGRTLKRIKSKAPLYLTGLTDTVRNSVRESSTYAQLEIPMSNASKILYDKKFKREVISRYSDTAWKEIEKGMRDIIGSNEEFNSFDKTLMFLKRQLSTGLLGLNPFVIAIQPASFPGYGVYIEPKYLKRGMTEYTKSPSEMAERHAKNSPEYRERVEVGYNVDVHDVIEKSQKAFSEKKSLVEKVMTPIQMSDKAAVTPGTQAGVLKVKDEIREGELSDIVKSSMDVTDAEVKKMTPEEQTKLAYEFADFVTAKTQPMFSPEHRSSLSRGKAWERLLTMFGSYTSRAKDLMVSTGLDAKRLKSLQQGALENSKSVKEARGKFVKAIFAVLVINTAAAMTKDELRNLLYGRKSKANFVLKVLKSWSGLFFGVRDIAHSLFTALDRGTSYGVGVETSPVSLIPNLTFKSVYNIADALTAETQEKRKKAMVNAIDDLANLILTGRFGLPYQPVKSVVKAVRGPKKKTRKTRRIIE